MDTTRIKMFINYYVLLNNVFSVYGLLVNNVSETHINWNIREINLIKMLMLIRNDI